MGGRDGVNSTAQIRDQNDVAMAAQHGPAKC